MQLSSYVAALASATLFTAASNAAIFQFSVYENATNSSLVGVNVSVDVTQNSAGTIDFTFLNQSVAPNAIAAINEIYFERTAFSIASLSGPTIVFEPAGVNFNIEASPGSPPGGNTIGFNNSIAEARRTGGGGNRINAGESLGIRFNLIGSATFASVINAISNDSFRMGMHIQSVGPNANSVSAVSRIPSPASAAVLGLAGLVATRRRR